MGRPKGSYTVAKSFTIGLKEAALIEEKMQKGKKASEVINGLIHAEMKKEIGQVKETTHWCQPCSSLTTRTSQLLCTSCGYYDKVLAEIIARQT